ncbi:MAG TPA: hypothetical protein ENK02_12130 [Planctomycetes bacterium]|nr:hypothetical protein [Planctomycetota bacterium]
MFSVEDKAFSFRQVPCNNKLVSSIVANASRLKSKGREERSKEMEKGEAKPKKKDQEEAHAAIRILVHPDHHDPLSNLRKFPRIRGSA